MAESATQVVKPHAVVVDPKVGRPKRYINKDSGEWVTKDKDGKEVVVTPFHDVDDEVTVSGRIISVSTDSEGYELVDVAVKALSHSTVPTLQFTVVKMDSENAVIVVPGLEVRKREEAEAEAKEKKLAEEKKKAAEEEAKLAAKK